MKPPRAITGLPQATPTKRAQIVAALNDPLLAFNSGERILQRPSEQPTGTGRTFDFCSQNACRIEAREFSIAHGFSKNFSWSLSCCDNIHLEAVRCLENVEAAYGGDLTMHVRLIYCD
jgi:hypothetical protein